MKSKIIITLFTAVIFLSYKSEAQLPHLSLYVHGLYAAALNTHSADRYNGGLGANAGLTLGSKNSRAVFSLGYTNFFAKHDSPDHLLGDETYIPAKIGLRQYLPLTLHTVFIQGDVGVGFIGYKNTSDTKSRFAADIGAVRILVHSKPLFLLMLLSSLITGHRGLICSWDLILEFRKVDGRIASWLSA